MEQKLKDYVSGEIHYTPINNIMLNNRSKEWFSELGRYIMDTLDTDSITELEFFSKKFKEEKNLITKIKDFIDKDKENRVLFFIASSFFTSVLDEQSLRRMFGEPLFHDEFGEGFEGEYDEETDERGEPDIKESYASYFVNVDGTEFHIGYDQRGTSIEIQKPSKFRWEGKISDKVAQKCFESLKKLVDLYKLKN